MVESKLATFIPKIEDFFIVICKLIQYLFCISNNVYYIAEQILEYSKANKMMNHIENMHFLKYDQGKVKYKYTFCKKTDLTSSSLMTFKNYTTRKYKILLYI